MKDADRAVLRAQILSEITASREWAEDHSQAFTDEDGAAAAARAVDVFVTGKVERVQRQAAINADAAARADQRVKYAEQQAADAETAAGRGVIKRMQELLDRLEVLDDPLGFVEDALNARGA